MPNHETVEHENGFDIEIQIERSFVTARSRDELADLKDIRIGKGNYTPNSNFQSAGTAFDLPSFQLVAISSAAMIEKTVNIGKSPSHPRLLSETVATNSGDKAAPMEPMPLMTPEAMPAAFCEPMSIAPAPVISASGPKVINPINDSPAMLSQPFCAASDG